MITMTDLPMALASRVNETASGCWEWTGWRNDANYGYVRTNGRDHCAHRVAYEALVGPIPDGLELDHLCTNPPCINPAHLEPVTHAENQRRIAARQTACRRAGHDWTDPNNVRVRPNGRRWCAECDRQDQRRRHSEKTGKPFQGAMVQRTHCPQGHPYDESNTYLNGGRRHCKACNRERNRARRAARIKENS